MSNDEWKQRGLCRGNEKDLWFSSVQEERDEAKRICSACPVRTECLATALADENIQGIWAGTDREERKKLRRKNNLSGRPAETLAAAPFRHRDGRPMRKHLLDSEGNAVCRPATRIDAATTAPAKDVPCEERCQLAACKAEWLRLDYLGVRCA